MLFHYKHLYIGLCIYCRFLQLAICTSSLDMNIKVDPTYAAMFGGRMINISGNDFQRKSTFKCSFSSNKLDPEYQVTSDAMFFSTGLVRCHVPMMLVLGRVNLSLFVDDAKTNPTPFTIVLPGRMPSGEFATLSSDWYAAEPRSPWISWDGSLLSNQSGATVDIELVGYRETSSESTFSTLATLVRNVAVNKDKITIQLSDETQCSDENCLKYEVGLIKVSLKQEHFPNTYRFLTAQKAIPLGWYVNPVMKKKHGPEWPKELCQAWYRENKNDKSWLEKIPSCPCTLPQALLDFGRWQPDNGCNMFSESPGNCKFHKEAVHCARSVKPVDDAGNQCCYRKSGEIVFSGDTYNGSTPDLSHDWGAAPYGKPRLVPSLSHWVLDIVQLLYCCVWTGYQQQSCDKYMELRSTRDCSGYTPPNVASVFGQGHIVPFKSSDRYMMKSSGIFSLLRAGSSLVQGKFQKNPSIPEDTKQEIHGVTLTSVAVWAGLNSDIVELSLARSIEKRISVLLNKAELPFGEKGLRWQEFNGVVVVNNGPDYKLQGNYTVILDNEIGIQVTEQAGTMHMDLLLPKHTKTTAGLLINAGSEDKWLIKSPSKCLFKDCLAGGSPKDLPTGSQKVAWCFNIEECNDDFRFTGSKKLAMATLKARQRYESLMDNLKPVRTCKYLNVPWAIKSDMNYKEGTRTTITGCRTGLLSGTKTYSCEEKPNASPEWVPTVDAKCTGNGEAKQTQEASSGLVTGIILAVIVVVLVAILIIGLVVRRRIKANQRRGPANGRHRDETVKMKGNY